MTSVTVLQQAQLESISREARDVHLGRVLLAVIAALFFAIGWLAARLFLGVAWCGVAVRRGWREGRAYGPAGAG